MGFEELADFRYRHFIEVGKLYFIGAEIELDWRTHSDRFHIIHAFEQGFCYIYFYSWVVFLNLSDFATPY